MRASGVVALALALGAFFVAQEGLTDLASGTRVDFANDVEVIFLFWATWACLTPAVLAAVRRWPLDLEPAYRPALAHVFTAALLSAVQSGITPAVRATILNSRGGIDIQEAIRRNANLTPFVWSVLAGWFFQEIARLLVTKITPGQRACSTSCLSLNSLYPHADRICVWEISTRTLRWSTPTLTRW